MRRDLPTRALWLAAVVVFALGAAGLVTAMSHRPGTESREELTWRADRAVRPELEAAIGELDEISLDFEALGRQGRIALGALTTGDAAQLAEAMDAGQALVARISAAVAGLRARLATLPGFGPTQDREFSPETIELWNDIHLALDTTEGLDATWLSLRTGGADGVRLMALLEQHDEFVGSAAKVGSEGDYAEAVRQLELAAPVMAELRALEASLGRRVDVALLSELLDRTTRLDDALRSLYTLMVMTGGEQTAEVDAALAEVDAARKALPEDTRALSVILSEIGLGGPQQAVIAIEEARGRLLDAIGALGRPEASDEVVDENAPGSPGTDEGESGEPVGSEVPLPS